MHHFTTIILEWNNQGEIVQCEKVVECPFMNLFILQKFYCCSNWLLLSCLKSLSIICELEIKTINFTEFTSSGEQDSIGPFIMTLSWKCFSDFHCFRNLQGRFQTVCCFECGLYSTFNHTKYWKNNSDRKKQYKGSLKWVQKIAPKHVDRPISKKEM